MISFTVFGSPVAQPRTKAQAFMSKTTGKIFAHVYEPGKKDSPARQWKSDVKQEAIKFKPAAPWPGPVQMDIVFYFPRPKRLMRARDPEGPIPHISKPDRDNCEKAVADALKGIMFVDDCQIFGGEIEKFYHGKNDAPRAEIVINFL